MNHRSERLSPGGSTAWLCHWSNLCVLVNDPFFSTCEAAGSRNTSVGISSVFSSPLSISGSEQSCAPRLML